MKFKLEICVDNIQSAIEAEEAGADRVELCGNLLEGGTTPGAGAIQLARESLKIGLHVIIRPRGGDFLYDDQEYEVMKRDITTCLEYGVDGVVLGILKSDGEIDLKRTAYLVELAHPMSVTFHRAFDMCSDPFRGLEDVIDTGSNRLLTSGQKDKAPEGADLISKLMKQAGSRIIIMPGGGLNISNIEFLARNTGATEFHLTARKTIESRMKFRMEGITMGGIQGISEFSRKIADRELIKKVIQILNSI